MLPGIGPMELIVIGVVGVVIFGKKLPTIARSVGSSFVEFRKGLTGVDDEIKQINKEVKNPLS